MEYFKMEKNLNMGLLLKILCLSTDVYNIIYFCFTLALGVHSLNKGSPGLGRAQAPGHPTPFLKSSPAVLSQDSGPGWSVPKGRLLEPESPGCPGKIHQGMWAGQASELVPRSQADLPSGLQCFLPHGWYFLSRFFANGKFKNVKNGLFLLLICTPLV